MLCRENGQPAPLLNLHARGASEKIHPGLKFLSFATCRFVGGGSGEIPLYHIITALKWKKFPSSGRASLGFDPEGHHDRHIFFFQKSHFGFLRRCNFQEDNQGDAHEGAKVDILAENTMQPF